MASSSTGADYVSDETLAQAMAEVEVTSHPSDLETDNEKEEEEEEEEEDKSGDEQEKSNKRDTDDEADAGASSSQKTTIKANKLEQEFLMYLQEMSDDELDDYIQTQYAIGRDLMLKIDEAKKLKKNRIKEVKKLEKIREKQLKKDEASQKVKEELETPMTLNFNINGRSVPLTIQMGKPLGTMRRMIFDQLQIPQKLRKDVRFLTTNGENIFDDYKARTTLRKANLSDGDTIQIVFPGRGGAKIVKKQMFKKTAPVLDADRDNFNRSFEAAKDACQFGNIDIPAFLSSLTKSRLIEMKDFVMHNKTVNEKKLSTIATYSKEYLAMLPVSEKLSFAMEKMQSLFQMSLLEKYGSTGVIKMSDFLQDINVQIAIREQSSTMTD